MENDNGQNLPYILISCQYLLDYHHSFPFFQIFNSITFLIVSTISEFKYVLYNN